MNEMKYLKGWDKFNFDLYLRYLEAKMAKEELEKNLEKKKSDKEF